jgi:hypothetical protein
MATLNLHQMNAMADAAEDQMARDLDVGVVRSVLFTLGAVDRSAALGPKRDPDQRMLMGQDPRLPPMPAKPKLIDFFRLRFGPSAHLLQSAKLALKAGHPEKIVIACLLHDIGVVGFIRSDHGYWGAQLVEPYVDEEVSWAIRHHQAIRFYPDESVGYEYPDLYLRLFGPDYRPDPYIDRDYQYARNHKWYMTARLVTLNDYYAFDPNTVVEIDEFEDIIGRNFRQPEEGLGWDNSPSSHMWRTLIAPTKFL